MTEKKFHIPAEHIRSIIPALGGCIATDKIVVDGLPVGFMQRDPPRNDMDSGWGFMSGYESDEYMNDAKNHGIYDVNTIANYDPSIVPFLHAPVGSAFGRKTPGAVFEPIEYIPPMD
ncbi:MAG: DUF2185 domain-containing protein [Phycisphaerales bacterium]